MTTIVERPSPTRRHLAAWAWICDGLALVVFAGVSALGLVNQDEAGSSGIWSKVVLVAVCALAPIAGAILGVRAHRAGERSATAAAVVAGLLLVGVPVALFLLVI